MQHYQYVARNGNPRDDLEEKKRLVNQLLIQGLPPPIQVVKTGAKRRGGDLSLSPTPSRSHRLGGSLRDRTALYWKDRYSTADRLDWSLLWLSNGPLATRRMGWVGGSIATAQQFDSGRSY